ncbi:transposase [Streptomyces sp. NPDC056194]|uniref:transposase n=1 Tax=unclassified Streptomyces TaxID=2593676 RepID=UPI0035DE927B
MTDAKWAAVRPLLPVPACFQGRSGRPEGYCHRQLSDTIRYLVAGGISRRAMPADFPAYALGLGLLPPPARARAERRVPRPAARDGP